MINDVVVLFNFEISLAPRQDNRITGEAHSEATSLLLAFSSPYLSPQMVARGLSTCPHSGPAGKGERSQMKEERAHIF